MIKNKPRSKVGDLNRLMAKNEALVIMFELSDYESYGSWKFNKDSHITASLLLALIPYFVKIQVSHPLVVNTIFAFPSRSANANGLFIVVGINFR